MMPREQFMKLKSGDVVLYNGRPRIVWDGPADHAPRRNGGSVHFAIKHRSWTGRIHTCQLWNDLKHKISLPPAGTFKSLRELRSIEREMLASHGFKVADQLAREIADSQRLDRCFGSRRTKPRVFRLALNALKSARATR